MTQTRPTAASTVAGVERQNLGYLTGDLGWKVLSSKVGKGAGDWWDHWVVIELPSGSRQIGYFCFRTPNVTPPSELFATGGSIAALTCPVEFIQAADPFKSDIEKFWAQQVLERARIQKTLAELKAGDFLKIDGLWSKIRSAAPKGLTVVGTPGSSRSLTKDQVSELVHQGDFVTEAEHFAAMGGVVPSATKIDLTNEVFCFEN